MGGLQLTRIAVLLIVYSVGGPNPSGTKKNNTNTTVSTCGEHPEIYARETGPLKLTLTSIQGSYPECITLEAARSVVQLNLVKTG